MISDARLLYPGLGLGLALSRGP